MLEDKFIKIASAAGPPKFCELLAIKGMPESNLYD
jgi:hypothetical protein